jgi:Membrane bound beta barrel domain (DUF5777)
MKNLNRYIRQVAALTLKAALILFFIFSSWLKAGCQYPDSSKSIFKGGSYEGTFSTSRIGLAQSVMTTPQGELHLVIQHRFGLLETGSYDFFGLDGAIPRFGFDYGFTNWLSGGIGRSLGFYEKTYDFELKAAILKQNESNIPVSLSYYTSVMYNTLQGAFPEGHNSTGSRFSFASQIFIARNQGIFSLQVAPVWLHSNYDINNGSKLDIYAVDLAGRIRFAEKFGFIAEYVGILTNTNVTKTNPLTLGLDINTGGHQFQLIFSNSQGLNEKSYLTNNEGSWSKGHIYFGFNLTRVFFAKND